MALKPLRSNGENTNISMFMNQVAERGGIVTYVTSTSGLGGMDDAGAVCAVPTGGIGVPVGILMNDVVDVDQTRYRINWHRDEMPVGGKVTIRTKGMVQTNRITPGVNPVPGSGAYFSTSGFLTMTQPANGTHSYVGRFDSAKDADGYARVEINLPR